MSVSNPANGTFAEQQLTEEDAETALLSIGARLTWIAPKNGSRPVVGYLWEMAVVTDSDRQQNYSVSIRPEPRGEQARAEVTFWVKGQLDQAKNDKEKRHHFPSLAAAKAACERHHAMGSWD